MSRLAEAVGAREALREETHEARRGQADDIQVVPLDRPDERCAPSLDRVRAGAPLPLAGGEVGREVARRQLAERDARALVLDFFPARGQEAKAGHDDVRLAGELLEHLLRLRRIGRLAEDLTLQHDLGVDAQYGTVACDPGDAPCLPLRVLANDLRRVSELRRFVLLVERLDDVEWNAELFEDCAPLRRARREQQRRCRRRVSHVSWRPRLLRTATSAPTRPSRRRSTRAFPRPPPGTARSSARRRSRSRAAGRSACRAGGGTPPRRGPPTPA